VAGQLLGDWFKAAGGYDVPSHVFSVRFPLVPCPRIVRNEIVATAWFAPISHSSTVLTDPGER
jgi:hypothetical protein